MHVCNECGKRFEEPKFISSWQGDSENGGYVSYPFCPVCGSDDIEELSVCAICGIDFEKPDIFDDFTGDYCESCQAEIDGSIKNAFHGMIEESSFDKVVMAVSAWCEHQ